MPTTITDSTGVSRHLFQLPQSCHETTHTIRFTELENDLSDGYYAQVLFGSNTGLRSWSLRLPTLAALNILPNTVTGIDGSTVSREEYIWSLYCETKVTGEPFVYQDPRSSQYYLVRFDDKQLSYSQQSRFQVKLYSTGIELKQVRISGVTVFDVAQAVSNYGSVIWSWLKGSGYDDGTSTWVPATGAQLFGAGDVDKETAVQNGHDIVRLNDTTNDGFLSEGLSGLSTNEFFIVMKMREATFSNAAGIITGAAGSSQLLLGSSGTTKFANPGLSATTYTYELNGLEYAQSNLQAPMAEFGLVHVRYTTGWAFAGSDWQIGKDRGTAGTFAEMDVGEVIMCSGLLPRQVSREITEYLMVKYAIT